MWAAFVLVKEEPQGMASHDLLLAPGFRFGAGYDPGAAAVAFGG